VKVATKVNNIFSDGLTVTGRLDDSVVITTGYRQKGLGKFFKIIILFFAASRLDVGPTLPFIQRAACAETTSHLHPVSGAIPQSSIRLHRVLLN
jgi:hypothetical protein